MTIRWWMVVILCLVFAAVYDLTHERIDGFLPDSAPYIVWALAIGAAILITIGHFS